jgi:matrixin
MRGSPAPRKRSFRNVLLGVALILATATLGRGFSLIRVLDLVAPPAHWPVGSLPLPMLISSAGSDNVPNPDTSDNAAIIAGQAAWNRINTDYFVFAAPTIGTGTAFNQSDGKNSIFFDETGAVFGTGSSAIAATFLNIDGPTGVISDADLIFNGALPFSTATPTPSGAFDIQGIATHELGHVTGMDHGGIVSAVMFPVGADGEQFQRRLAPDDQLGDSSVYPETAAGAGIAGLQAGDGDLSLITGSITGAVRTAGGLAVPGAHVVALDPTGAAVVSDVSRLDGSYTLPVLLPGSYKVYAEPLDGVTIEQDMSQSDSMNAFTAFVTTFVGGNASPTQIPVVAGASSPGNDVNLGNLYGVETEANNTSGAANPVALEALTSGIGNPAGDVDFFSFPGATGDIINIDLDASGDGFPLDPVISLISTDGTTVLTPTNDDFPGKGNDSRIVRRLAATGTFFVRVEDFSNLAGGDPPIGGPGFFYTLHVNKAIPEVDIVGTNDNNSIAAADAAAIGQHRGGIITSGDVDFYSFTAGFADRIIAEVSANRAGSTLNPTLTLFRSNGAQLAVNTDIGGTPTNLDSLIDFTFAGTAVGPLPATFYLRVSAAAGAGASAFYDLHIGTDSLNAIYSGTAALGMGFDDPNWLVNGNIFPKFLGQGTSTDVYVGGPGIPFDPTLALAVSGAGVTLTTPAGADFVTRPDGLDLFDMSASISASAAPGPRSLFIRTSTLNAVLSGAFVIVPSAAPAEQAPGSSLLWSGPQLTWAADPASSTYNLYRGALPLVDSDLNGLADSYGSPLACDLTAPLAADPAVPALGSGFTYLVTGRNAIGEGSLGFALTPAGATPERPKSALNATCP